MLRELADYYDRLQALHGDFRRLVEALPPEALSWAPGPGMNSLAVLVTHAMGAERFWIGDMAGQEPSGRVREDEFRASAQDASDLVVLLDGTLEHSQHVLERLDRASLRDQRRSERHERSFSVGWCLAHALEHTAIHLGHAEITRQLWDQRGG